MPLRHPDRPLSDDHATRKAATVTAVQATEESTHPRKARRRNPYFDNAKFLAIILVVIGHALSRRYDLPLSKGLYAFVYAFHMPVFILITGYFAQRFTQADGKVRKLISGVIAPYLIFEALLSATNWLVTDEDFGFTPLEPYWINWFMAALIVWRLSTPVWQQLRWPLLFAILLSLGVGLVDLPIEKTMHRAFGMMPFFVAGLLLREEHLRWLRQRWVKIAAAAVMVCAVVGAIIVVPHVSMEWVFWRKSYDGMGQTALLGLVGRAGMMAVAFALVAAFLALVPTRETWFTRLGPLTMYAYFGHALIYIVGDGLNWWDAIPGGYLGIAIILTVSALLGAALCTTACRFVLRPFVEPPVEWAFKEPPEKRREQQEEAAAARASEPRSG
ncbi:MAG: acyltransferase family protein [Streptosporangiales bacterium]|nr:acyltransferase family protein [Streptosporangiales bacterium]